MYTKSVRFFINFHEPCFISLKIRFDILEKILRRIRQFSAQLVQQSHTLNLPYIYYI